MTVLRVCFGFIITRFFRQIFFAVGFGDEFVALGARFFGNTKRVGTHIGDKTHCAVAFDVDAFVKLLRDFHRAFALEAEFARALLL